MRSESFMNLLNENSEEEKEEADTSKSLDEEYPFSQITQISVSVCEFRTIFKD